jgi:tetratricopeptide (TPR) repeat protein
MRDLLHSHENLWTRLRSAVRTHERLLAIIYLAAVTLVLGAFFVAPLQRILLSQVERVADYVEDRWGREFREGERLVAEERFEEAAVFLEDLAARFPARNSRHARTVQMQRILSLLGSSQHALGRKARTLHAYREAVLHDPRNYSNHVQLAQAALSLSEPEEAWEHFQNVLSIHPSHLPSLEGVVKIAMDGEDAPGVVQAYERYLDALVVRDVEVRLGDSSVVVPVVADGRFRTIESTVMLPEGWSGEIALSANEAIPDLQRLEIRPPLRVGEPGGPAFDLQTEGTLTVASTTDAGQPARRYSLALNAPTQPLGAARVVMRLRLLKPVHAGTWWMIEGAYATVLDRPGATAARERSFVVEEEG